MLLKIVTDAYRFFDRRWLYIITAALISLGIAESIVMSVYYLFPDPLKVLKNADDAKLSIGYADIIEPFLLLLVKIWFDGFVALLFKYEVEDTAIQIKKALSKSFAVYPKLTLIYFVAQLLIVPSVFALVIILSSDPTGLLSVAPLISIIVLYVWFSLVIPVAVIDDLTKIIPALKRSRYLVDKYFMIVAVLLLVSSVPSLGMFDVSSTNAYAKLIAILLYFASMVMESLVTLFAYIHLRTVKGEALIEQTNAAAQE
ncbi:MAG: hypothetical protein HY779_01585 [Rubrobacteridae bacterium]|nr:hypothetical protein [Rubrobacteridae bacterium]